MNLSDVFDLALFFFAVWSFVDMYIYSDGPWEIMSRSYRFLARRSPMLKNMLMCPKCLGTWTALALLPLYLFLPDVFRLMAIVLSASGVSTILDHWQRKEEWIDRV